MPFATASHVGSISACIRGPPCSSHATSSVRCPRSPSAWLNERTKSKERSRRAAARSRPSGCNRGRNRTPGHCARTALLVRGRRRGASHDRAAVQRALDQWRGEALETAAADAGLVVTACRSFAEWDAHPQGRAIARLPPFTIDQIGDAPARPMGAADRPLAGVKVLDLARIIAGPVCGRTLAGHGRDVLLITASHLPSMQPLVIDTGRGKLSTSIDLRQSSGRETLAALLLEADVFVHGYRPSASAALGFGPQEAAR